MTSSIQNCVQIGTQYQELVLFWRNIVKLVTHESHEYKFVLLLPLPLYQWQITCFLCLIKSGCYSHCGLGLAHPLWNDSWNSKSSSGKLQRLTTTTPEQILWCLGCQQRMCYFGNKQASWYFFEYQFCFRIEKSLVLKSQVDDTIVAFNFVTE